MQHSPAMMMRRVPDSDDDFDDEQPVETGKHISLCDGAPVTLARIAAVEKKVLGELGAKQKLMRKGSKFLSHPSNTLGLQDSKAIVVPVSARSVSMPTHARAHKPTYTHVRIYRQRRLLGSWWHSLSS